MRSSSLSNNIKRTIARGLKRIGRFVQYWGEDVDFSMENLIDSYRKIGIQMGNNVYLVNVYLDPIFPELITIGNDVTITNSVILTHDECPVPFVRQCRADPVRIGNNVFIGYGSLILPGVTIGNNCIIGAGSVVAKSIPDDSVAAGIPAKVIKTMPKYLEQLSSSSSLLSIKVQSSVISESEHEAMRNEVLRKYRPDLIDRYCESA